jgi:hypothetical protein
VLRVVTAALVHQGRSVLLVTRNAGGQGRAADGGGRVPPAGGAPGVTEVTPDDVDAVVAARRRDRRTAVLVDDADLLDDAPVAGVLREILGLVDRDGGLFVAVTTSTGLVTRFRGLDVQVARRACGLLLAPHPRDGDVLGVPVPRGIPTTPGRGVFVQGGVATEAQVYLVRSPHPTVSGVGAPVGVGGREGLGGHRHPERRHGREGGEPEHEPAHEGLVALHETETHGNEEGAPYEGGRPGPATADQPPAGQGGQPHPAQEDQHGRHDDPGRVTPLAENELHDVEEGETDERQRLDGGEGSDETAWPA